MDLALGTVTLSPMRGLVIIIGLTGLLAGVEVPEGAILAFPGDEERPGASAIVIATGRAVTLTEALPSGPGPWNLHRLGGGTVPARVAQTGPTITVLDVPRDLPVLPTADQEPAVGDEVWTIGNAAGAVALDGRPARSRGHRGAAVELDGRPVHGRGGEVVSAWAGPVWEIDAAINEGAQGGAVVDAQGRLVALATLAVGRERRLPCVIPWRLAAAAAGMPAPVAGTSAPFPAWVVTLRVLRPQAPASPFPRPTRTVRDAAPYERDDLQRAWDQYWHTQQVARTDQPVPGILIDPEAGLVLTAAGNLHGGATEAVLGTGQRLRLRAVDLPLDLALLEAGAPLPGPAAPWATAAPAVGQPVTVLGTGGSATGGRVSTVDRRLAQADEVFLQVDARANFGSLGGPVLLGGSVAGVVVHLGPEVPWLMNSGVTLAADARTVQGALPALRAGQSRARLPVLGLGVQLREEAEGLVVQDVIPGTGAAEAGLLPGDVLVGVAGRDATSRAGVARALARRSAGEAIPVVVVRGHRRLDLTVELRRFGG